MAIYVDGKVLKPNKTGTSLEKKYFNELKEVKGLFNKFKVDGVEDATIILTRDFTKQYNRSKSSWKPAPPMALPLVTHIYDDEMGSVEVRYSKTPPRKVKAGVLQWDASKDDSMFFETLALVSNKLDYAWFMLKATNYLGKSLFRIVDTRAEYGKLFKDVVLQKEVMGLLFDKQVTEEWLAKVAVGFMEDVEIDYSSVSGKEELAMKIWEKAMNNSKNKKPGGLDDLKVICARVGSYEKPPPPPPQIITMPGEDGGSVEIPLLKCPPATDFFALKKEADELGIASQGKKKDVLFSMIEYKKGKVLAQ